MTDRQPARSETPRGFAIYDEFDDTRGLKIRVQESSIATYDGLWVFASSETEGISPHLNLEQATWLRDALDTFIREHTREDAEGDEAECSHCTTRITLLGGSWTADDSTTACTDTSAPYVAHKPEEG